jgi:hypothetical protein
VLTVCSCPRSPYNFSQTPHAQPQQQQGVRGLGCSSLNLISLQFVPASQPNGQSPANAQWGVQANPYVQQQSVVAQQANWQAQLAQYHPTEYTQQPQQQQPLYQQQQQPQQPYQQLQQQQFSQQQQQQVAQFIQPGQHQLNHFTQVPSLAHPSAQVLALSLLCTSMFTYVRTHRCQPLQRQTSLQMQTLKTWLAILLLMCLLAPQISFHPRLVHLLDGRA